MCDLIDFNSPDARNIITSKLAPPLIPVPASSSNDSPPNNVKRNSLDNNPFDTALKKVVENVCKEGDPFEVVLEKAMKSKGQKDASKARSVEFKDDFTPKQTRYSQVLKMNKTLDESLIEADLSLNLSQNNTASEQSFIQDLNNTNLLSETRIISDVNDPLSDHRHDMPNISIHPPSPNDLSILNQSAMDDELFKNSSTSEEDDIKAFVAQRISLCIQKGTIDASNSPIRKDHLKFMKHRRSLSQGDGQSPESPRQFRQRSRSIIESMRKNLSDDSRSSVSTSVHNFSNDTMNKAFLRRHSSASSGISDITYISAISGLNSASSIFTTSSAFSDGNCNRAFLDSRSGVSLTQEDSIESSGLNSSNTSRLKSTGSVSSVLTTAVKTPVKIDDLAQRLQRLKLLSMCNGSVEGTSVEQCAMSSESMNANSNSEDKAAVDKAENCNESEGKLIDVDVFLPEQEKKTLRKSNKSSTSSVSSSDSVFAENNIDGKTVLTETKAPARTFESPAQRTSSSCSSGSDLLNSQPRWNFDMLPVSDDEVLVDDLIQLPSSPAKPENNSNTNSNVELAVITESKLLDLNTPKKDSEVIKELESEFIDHKVTEKKVMAATLLLDLEKLIKMEDNPEAASLLENLEKVLGINCESNAELLAACLQEPNDLSKSTKKPDCILSSNNNIKQESLESSQEDNMEAGSSESIRELELSKNGNLEHHSNTNKEINKSQKLVILPDDKLADITPVTEASYENSCEKSSSDDSISMEKKQNQITADQKIAMELLVNLGKVLNGNNEESSTLNLLSNLGKVLNLATTCLNFETFENVEPANDQSLRVGKTDTITSQKKVPNKLTADAPKSQYNSTLSKSASRRSLDSAVKEQRTVEKPIRRSISGGSIRSHNVSVSPHVSKDNSKPLLTDKKRLPDDPGVRKNITVKPTVVPEIRKTKTPTMIDNLKSKFKKKSDTEVVVNKKGPLKAVLPLGNMQRRGSLGKKVSPMSATTTPPKSSLNTPSVFTVTSSTPNPIVALNIPKQSPKTKPVASSTPDVGDSKTKKVKQSLTLSSVKRNLSCNISPVPPLNANVSIGSGTKGTPKKDRFNKTLSPPRESTSKDRQALNVTESSIPKYTPLVGFPRRRSSIEGTRNQDGPESPKIKTVKQVTPHKSPFGKSRSDSQIPQSPLRNSNKQSAKLKPFNLTSKFRRGSSGSIVAEKENFS